MILHNLLYAEWCFPIQSVVPPCFPEGVGKFKSKFNKDVEYKFEVPGIYAYWCTPHKNMGMIGFVVVGDDKSNIEAIKKLRFSSKSKKMAPDLINSL